ncbi:ExbD/TolR family protein [Psychromonas aquatilis]|uniref:Biopolymer transporter ExbD n=1 Tax=Psychromonas aquatilis TaxID=2005072 RepID=A0ABU9GNI5_9GAMM
MIQFEEDSGLEPITPETMTPMIDVILSLIAFMMLMINTPLMTMDIDLPDINQADIQSPAEEKVIHLQILEENNQWLIADELITSENKLKTKLMTLVVNADEPVATVLDIDQNSPAQRMIETLDILKRLGINNTHIALEQKVVDGL